MSQRATRSRRADDNANNAEPEAQQVDEEQELRDMVMRVAEANEPARLAHVQRTQELAARPAPVDPMVEEMKRLAEAPQRKKAKKSQQEQDALRQQREQAAIGEMEAELRKQELLAKQEEAAHKRHVEMEKQRMEQMKQFTRATKMISDAKGEEQAEAMKGKDTAGARDDAIRKIMMLREECGARGSGRRLTMDTPLSILLAELELCHTQLNLERAADMPEQIFFSLSGALETALLPFADFGGTTEQFNGMLQASRKAPDGSLESHLDRAFKQCSIKYSHVSFFQSQEKTTHWLWLFLKKMCASPLFFYSRPRAAFRRRPRDVHRHSVDEGCRRPLQDQQCDQAAADGRQLEQRGRGGI